MIEKIQEIVIRAMQEKNMVGEWREIRKNYFWYSYLTFIAIAVDTLTRDLGNPELILKVAEDKNLIEHSIVEYIKTLPKYKEVLSEISLSIKAPTDINLLYQQYISSDFHVLPDGSLTFEKGKNGRDVLGAYYTASEFAFEITQKAFNDLILQRSDTLKNENEIRKIILKLKILDSSCGSGEFLVSAIRYCKSKFKIDDFAEKKLTDNLYGIDVDPLAVLISKVRLMQELNSETASKHIILGNPLIVPLGVSSTLEKHMIAAEGRFYNDKMGINILDKSFDLILGNPPWEKIRFEEKKFLSYFNGNEIVIGRKKDRDSFLQSQISHGDKVYYNDVRSDYELFKKVQKGNKMFKFSAVGEANTYAMFTELCSLLRKKDGIVILIIKSSLVKTPVYKDFFNYLITKGNLCELYMFTNKKKIFQIDSREEFAVIVLGGNSKNSLKVALNLEDYGDFTSKNSAKLSKEFLQIINPLTGMLPNVKSVEEIKFLSDLYKSNRTLAEVYPECKFGRLVHLTNHSDFISKKERTGYLPIYEGKFIEQYTGKYASFYEVTEEEKYANKASALQLSNLERDEYPQSRYFIKEDFWNRLSQNFHEEYSIMWRSLTSATNRRTMLATILPHMPTCQSIQLLQLYAEDKCLLLQILALFNSVVFDYIVRLKMVGLDLTQTILKQIPVPEKKRYNQIINFKGKSDTLGNHIYCRVKYLYRNEKRLKYFFEQFDFLEIESKYHRKEIIADIDILIAKAYSLEEKKLKTIVKNFDKFYPAEEAKLWF